MSYRRKKKDKNMLAKPRPTVAEFAFMIIISGIVLGLFTYSDIVIHDGYVKPDLGECHDKNHSDFCEKLRKNLGCENQPQMCLYQKYGEVIVVQVWTFGILLIIVRLFLTYMAGRKIDDTAIMTSLLWGFTAIALFVFGFEDYLYYAIRGDTIPDQLTWLNQAGFFNYTKQFGADPQNVDNTDLTLTMFIGIATVMTAWVLAIYGTRKNARKIQRNLDFY